MWPRTLCDMHTLPSYGFHAMCVPEFPALHQGPQTREETTGYTALPYQVPKCGEAMWISNPYCTSASKSQGKSTHTHTHSMHTFTFTNHNGVLRVISYWLGSGKSGIAT